jgi:anti-sigma B factor antagonist
MDTLYAGEAIITPVSAPLHDIASERLRNDIRDHVQAGRLDHLIDLRELAELDSRSLAALIRALRVVREAGGSVGLIVDQPNFTRVLSITGLDRVFPVYKTDRDAFAAIESARLVPA